MNIVHINRKVIDFVKEPNQTHISALFAILGGMFFFWSTTLLAGQITLAWNASPDPSVGGYKLYYRQIGQGYSVVDVGYQTSFTLSTLQNGKAFCIAVTAYNVARTLESGFSNEVCKQLPPALRDINGDVKADLAGLSGTGQIFYTTNLSSWTNVPGQLSQLVAADLNGDGKTDLAGLTSTGQTFYTTNLSTWTNIPGQLTVLSGK